jgi:hypothetical protein
MKRTFTQAILSASFVVVSLVGATALGVELVTNGGFESGDFTGWTATSQEGSSGSFFVRELYDPTTVGPSSGVFYAVAQQFSASTHVLEQSFTIPGAASSVVLSFDQFVEDLNGFFSGAIVHPAGLDWWAVPNQHARVDMMAADADPFDTGEGVLANLFIGTDPYARPTPYTSYEFDITTLVEAGGTYKIRFAEVNNKNTLYQGVDNVSIQFTAIPEPHSLVSVGLALLSTLYFLRGSCHILR